MTSRRDGPLDPCSALDGRHLAVERDVVQPRDGEVLVGAFDAIERIREQPKIARRRRGHAPPHRQTDKAVADTDRRWPTTEEGLGVQLHRFQGSTWVAR